MESYRLPLSIEPLEEGGYLATSPALPGFLVQADTLEEIQQLAPGIAHCLLEVMREKGVAVLAELEPALPPFQVEILVAA